MVITAARPGAERVAPQGTAAPAPAHKPIFRSDVQVLRAVAVVLVVLNHAHVPGLGGGYVGVDVFFVISGYLITGLLIREKDRTGTISLLNFYARRMRRIMPAAALVMVATIVASYHYLGYIRGAAIATDAQWAAAFLANYHFTAVGTDYLGAQGARSTLQHFWSLAVEEQFYFVWPALFLIFALVARKTSSRAFAIVTVSAIVAASFYYSVTFTETNATAAYFSPFTRACELAAGALLALLATETAKMPVGLRITLAVGGMAGIVVTVLTFTEATTFPGTLVALPVLATCAVLAAGNVVTERGWLYGRHGRHSPPPVRHAPMQLIGLWSYSLYLWHWPLLTIAEQHAGQIPEPATRVRLIFWSVVLAAATYYLVENPVRDLRPLRAKPVLSVLTGLALIGVVSAVAFAETRTHPEVPSAGSSSTGSPAEMAARMRQFAAEEATEPGATDAEVRALVAEAPKIGKTPNDLKMPVASATDDRGEAGYDGCVVQEDRSEAPECVYGDKTAERTIVLYGDSHAGMWQAALDVAARRSQTRLVLLSKSACAVPDLHFWLESAQRPNTECDAWRTWATDRIIALKPDTVVLTSLFLGPRDFDKKDIPADKWAAGMTRTIKKVKTSGAKVVLLGDMPYLSQSAPECLAAHVDDVGACARNAGEAVQAAHGAEDKRTAEKAGAAYVDVIPWFCTDVCRPIIGDMVVYQNQYHITAAYSRYLSGVVGSAVGLT